MDLSAPLVIPSAPFVTTSAAFATASAPFATASAPFVIPSAPFVIPSASEGSVSRIVSGRSDAGADPSLRSRENGRASGCLPEVFMHSGAPAGLMYCSG